MTATTSTRSSRAVAKTEDAAQLPVTTELDGIDLSRFSGAGLEDAGAQDFAIPFLRVLQSNSPECDEMHARFMKDAKKGMLLNTVTQELFDGKDGVLFIPCHYQRRQLRWAARGTSSQGFRGEVSEAEAAKARSEGELVDYEGRSYFTTDGKVDPKKNDRLVDTRMHFGLVLNKDGIPNKVLLTLVSTQIKKSKLFNTMQRERTVTLPDGKVIMAPSFYNVYRITTVPESNDQGSWFGVHFTLEGRVPNAAIFEYAAAFYDALRKNEERIDLAGAGEDFGERDGHDSNNKF